MTSVTLFADTLAQAVAQNGRIGLAMGAGNTICANVPLQDFEAVRAVLTSGRFCRLQQPAVQRVREVKSEGESQDYARCKVPTGLAPCARNLCSWRPLAMCS